MRSIALIALAVALVAPVGGCKSARTIPGTEIPDTEDNREIINVIERYRLAVVKKDAALVLSTVHPTYHDEAGTEDPSDDVSYHELGPLLRRRLAQVDTVRFTIDYLEIFISGDRATVHVWIDASFRMKPILDQRGEPRSAPRYSRKQDYAKFELVREDESWLLVSGL